MWLFLQRIGHTHTHTRVLWRIFFFYLPPLERVFACVWVPAVKSVDTPVDSHFLFYSYSFDECVSFSFSKENGQTISTLFVSLCMNICLVTSVNNQQSCYHHHHRHHHLCFPIIFSSFIGVFIFLCTFFLHPFLFVIIFLYNFSPFSFILVFRLHMNF